MTDLVKRLVGLANSLGGDDEDVIMAGVADNERLRKCICDIYSIWENAAKEREAEIARLRKLNDEQQARMLDWHMQLTAKDAEIKRLTALRGDEAVAENARVVAEFAKLRAEIERLTALAQSNDDITWELTGENLRLRAALTKIVELPTIDGQCNFEAVLRDQELRLNEQARLIARRALEHKP